MTDKPLPSPVLRSPPSRVFRTCGGGMRRRVRALCGWAWWKAEDKFRRCRKSASDSRQAEYCNTLCPHGTWSAWLGKCRCNDGYRGLCCQQRTYNPRSPGLHRRPGMWCHQFDRKEITKSQNQPK